MYHNIVYFTYTAQYSVISHTMSQYYTLTQQEESVHYTHWNILCTFHVYYGTDSIPACAARRVSTLLQFAAPLLFHGTSRQALLNAAPICSALIFMSVSISLHLYFISATISWAIHVHITVQVHTTALYIPYTAHFCVMNLILAVTMVTYFYDISTLKYVPELIFCVSSTNPPLEPC